MLPGKSQAQQIGWEGGHEIGEELSFFDVSANYVQLFNAQIINDT